MPDTLDAGDEYERRLASLEANVADHEQAIGRLSDIAQASTGGPDFTPKEWPRSPTMPDTPEQRMIDIRQSHENRHYYGRCDNDCDTGWLLSHLDTLTAAVRERFLEASRRGMVYSEVKGEWGLTEHTILAILRGEQ